MRSYRLPPRRASAGLVVGLTALMGLFYACDGDGVTRPPPGAANTDIEVSKTVSSPTVDVGVSVTFTITVTNNGPIDAASLSAGDTLPTGLAYVGHSTSRGAYAAATGIWTIGTLPVGQSATLSLVARPEAGTAGDTLTNVAGAISGEFNDSVPANNVASASVIVTEPVVPMPAIDLSITKTVNDPTPAVGDTATFTVTATNAGPVSATQVLVFDTIPAGMNYQGHTVSTGSYDPLSGLWTVGTLGVGASAALSLRLSPATGTAQSTITNRGHVTSGAMTDSVPGNNTASASVTVEADQPPPGGLLFVSDWNSGTGTSLTALTDGGVWNRTYCNTIGDVLSVVAGGPVGWSGQGNVLRIQQLGTTCGMLEADDVLPQSTTHWGRFYFRNDETQTFHNHVVTYHPVGAIQLAIWNRNPSQAGFRTFMRTYFSPSGGAMPYPRYLWQIDQPLQNGTWYRYEWMMEYVTPTTYRIWPRIYNMSGTLVADANNYFFADAAPNAANSLAAHYNAGNSFGFTDVTLGRDFGLGQEGPAGSSSTNGFWYHANVALSLSGWIGP